MGAVLFCAALCCAPVTAWSQPAPGTAQLHEGRRHFDLAVRLYDRGELSAAAAEFRRAWELARRPGTLFNLAVTLQRLRRYPEAVTVFEQFIAEAPPRARRLRRRRRAAQSALAQLRPMLGSLRLEVEPSDASVSVDDRPVSAEREMTLTAGRVVVEVSREGYLTERRELVVGAGETRTESISLRRVPERVAVETAPTLVLRGAPDDAVLRVDGELRDGASPPLQAGVHRISLEAPGYLPWSGRAEFSRGQRYVLEVQLARRLDVRSTLPRWIVTVFAGAAAATAIGTGIGALETHAEFSRRTQSSPDVNDLASRGSTLAVTADVFTGVAVTAGAVALWLWLRPEPVQETSRGGVVIEHSP